MSGYKLAIAAALACIRIVTLVRADINPDEAAVKERLVRWTEAFNARDVAGICDLFEPDLRYTVHEACDRSRKLLCARLSALSAKRELQVHDDNPDVREIIIAGNITVVRLSWTLGARQGAARHWY